MKFWQKIFIGTFIIFVVVFDAGTFFLTTYAYNFNRQRETESGVREQSVILSSITSRIASVEKIYSDVSTDKERLTAIIQPLAEYYEPQGVLLALFDGGAEIYSNMPSIDKELLNLENAQSRNTADRRNDEKRYLYVTSQIPDYPQLTFVYARDISQIDEFRADVGRVFQIMNVIVMVLLGGAIYLLLRHMTRPITKLNKITAEIAGGAYDKRVAVNRSDELGILGHNFNRMADSVEENMARLTKAAEDRQQFIDDLTHEMKTPMTSILGYAEYLKNAKSSEEERIKAAENLHYAALRLKNLSVKLLELTFLHGEKIELQSVDVPTLFSALTNITHPILSTKNLKLTTRDDLTIISGDETLLLSMLANLVENAAKASKEGGSVTVKAYEKDYPIIEVSDTGHGMEQQEIDKITAPFYRVDKSRSRKFGGVGLGLSIVSQIADIHGAKLEIESVPDVGTTVRICFTTQ